jgi:hypothetical protein
MTRKINKIARLITEDPDILTEAQCAKCGRALDSDSKFCGGCGTKVEQGQQTGILGDIEKLKGDLATKLKSREDEYKKRQAEIRKEFDAKQAESEKELAELQKEKDDPEALSKYIEKIKGTIPPETLKKLEAIEQARKSATAEPKQADQPTSSQAQATLAGAREKLQQAKERMRKRKQDLLARIRK